MTSSHFSSRAQARAARATSARSRAPSASRPARTTDSGSWPDRRSPARSTAAARAHTLRASSRYSHRGEAVGGLEHQVAVLRERLRRRASCDRAVRRGRSRCGWFQTMSGLPPGLSRPSGPIIFAQRAPRRPRLRGELARVGQAARDTTRDSCASSSSWPHSAKCAVCHQIISVWCLPYQVLQVSPVSCGGTSPAICTAVRYCESMTRSSSFAARGIVLPEKSTAAGAARRPATTARSTRRRTTPRARRPGASVRT